MSQESDLEGAKTQVALEEAFAEEARLVFRYLYYATIAEFEGKEELAAAFRELAEGGLMNVHGCLDYLKLARDPDSRLPIGSTAANLQSLLQTEVRQFNQLYPERARQARSEGFTDVASWFDTLEKLKRAHARKLRELEKKDEKEPRG